jgi:putative long chain acyl-CoA synthase
VNNIVRGLIACGVLPTQRVGVMMHGRPTYLSLLAAINRIGAVAVLTDPSAPESVLVDAFAASEVAVLVVDPEHAERARELFDGEVFVLGGAGDKERAVQGVVYMEDIHPDAVKLPAWYLPNPGRARDLAMIIISPRSDGRSRSLHISNHRWAFSAYGAAAAATLTAKDTVYCCLPLHHAAGTMVSVGSALVSGARLALAEGFAPDTFWDETRRYGATVVFYAGEMCRQLVDAPHHQVQSRHPIRLFAGSGMRVDVWERLVDRFGPIGVLEFYASTETNAVLANASGEKAGAVGSRMPGSGTVALLRYDLQSGQLIQGAAGHCVPCPPGEAGLMVTKIRPHEAQGLRESRVLRSVFSPQDYWYSTRNLLRKDEDGDYWFVERISDLVNARTGRLLCLPVEDSLYASGLVSLAAAYGLRDPDSEEHQILVASLVLHEGRAIDAAQLDEIFSSFEEEARPRRVFVVESLPMSDGFRPVKSLLKGKGLPGLDDVLQTFAYESGSYEKLSA